MGNDEKQNTKLYYYASYYKFSAYKANISETDLPKGVLEIIFKDSNFNYNHISVTTHGAMQEERKVSAQSPGIYHSLLLDLSIALCLPRLAPRALIE